MQIVFVIQLIVKEIEIIKSLWKFIRLKRIKDFQLNNLVNSMGLVKLKWNSI